MLINHIKNFFKTLGKKIKNLCRKLFIKCVKVKPVSVQYEESYYDML